MRAKLRELVEAVSVFFGEIELDARDPYGPTGPQVLVPEAVFDRLRAALEAAKEQR
jgi:hypothetical protein